MSNEYDVVVEISADDVKKATEERDNRDAEITRLREENERLREALKPFAARLDELEKSPLTKYACATSVEIDHLRAARAAIREGGKDDAA